MTYFECTACGQLGDYVEMERRAFHAECPVCEETTRWTIAFEEEGQGVSF